MIELQEKTYEVVNKDNLIFNTLVADAWKEIGIDPEYLKQSDYLLVKNNEGQAIGTVEVAKYDKGFENKDLEDIYKFSKFQNPNVQLLYLDKVTIKKTERAVINNMILLMNSIFVHVDQIRTSNNQFIVALVRDRFYRYLCRILNLDITKLCEPIDGEVPILIDVEKNAHLLQTGEWIKLQYHQ